MGSDFSWKATEEDIFRQRKCGWFLESLFGKNGTEPASYFNPGSPWDYQTYEGFYTGYFLDYDNPQKVVGLETLQLIGTTFNLEGVNDMFDRDTSAVASGQYSFVFNNTSYQVPQLITLEIISDFSKPKYEYIKDYFSDVQNINSSAIRAVYKRGGYIWLKLGEKFSTDLLYAIREQFLPSLEISDEFDYFLESKVKAGKVPIPSDLSESVCKPSLANKWGFGHLDLLNKLHNQ